MPKTEKRIRTILTKMDKTKWLAKEMYMKKFKTTAFIFILPCFQQKYNIYPKGRMVPPRMLSRKRGMFLTLQYKSCIVIKTLCVQHLFRGIILCSGLTSFQVNMAGLISEALTFFLNSSYSDFPQLSKTLYQIHPWIRKCTYPNINVRKWHKCMTWQSIMKYFPTHVTW